ncbi:MAG: hypothetical protein ACR2JB_02250 [Bryobacteraceae bacterium]
MPQLDNALLDLSWKLEVGANLLEAMKHAGHTRLSTTFDYIETDAERERTQVRAILDRLMLQPKGPVQ